MKETKTFTEILLRRRNKLNIKSVLDNQEKDNIGRVFIIMKNINSLGYTLSKELIEYMRWLTDIEQNNIYKELVSCLKEYVGSDKDWTPMYQGFPQQVREMEDWELFVNAIVHYWSFGTLVPEYEKDERLPLFESPELTVIDLGTDEDLDEVMNNLISSKTSLSETDKSDMIWLINNRGVAYTKLPDVIPFKENVAVICKLILDNTSDVILYKVLHKYLKTATDILRFCVYLSDGDVSLSTPTKFKSFTRKERDLILHLLNGCGHSLEEDMKRNTLPWIRLGEILHPSEDKYEKYLNTYVAFAKLRNNGEIYTFGGIVEELIENGQIIKAVEKLKSRPGELARRLDQLLRKGYELNVCNAFEEVADKISIPVLLQVREHFKYRNEKNNVRVFFPKGSLSKVYVKENELEHISDIYCNKIVLICEKAIMKQFEEKESLGKVYIDDSIKGFCVPQSQRSASKSLKNITRGSRFKIKDDANFIRLGIHWMNEIYNGMECRTDIDLSCSFLDENFGHVEHVSWTHLRNDYSVHSGDLTSAPRSSGGSAEFIDIDINKAKDKGVKYAAIQIYGYTRTKFCDLDDMVFNWQECVDDNYGDIFEPSRVQQSINLGFDSDCGIPVVFDLENREVIWCDLGLTTRTSFPRQIESNIRGLSATVMGICQSHKPQMYELSVLNAMARGTIVKDRNEADVIFSNNLTKPIEIIKVEIRNENGELLETKYEEREKEVRFITTWDTDVWQGEML